VSIVGRLGKKAAERAACVKREWRDEVGTAEALGMYKSKLLSVAVRGRITSIATVDGVFTSGKGIALRQRGGAHAKELSPRLVEALAGKKVVGASMGTCHTVAWIETGELFTFGDGSEGRVITSTVRIFLRVIYCVLMTIIALFRMEHSPIAAWVNKQLIRMDTMSNSTAAVVKVAHTHQNRLHLCRSSAQSTL